MAGISSKALDFGDPQNKEKTFQGQRFDGELGLNWIQFKWRNHDPQIGRFIEIDPLAEKYEYNSTYAFSENKVINHVELEGLEAAMVVLPKQTTDEQRRDFYRGYNESLDRGGEKVLEGVALVAAIVGQPEISAGAKFLTRALRNSGNEESPVVGGNKKVPNPYGRNGGELHQEKINEVEKGMQERGLETKREAKIETPGGNKEKRYVDVEGKDPKTGKIERVQVGKQNKNGTPVSREKKALDDIEKATGSRPRFVPYNILSK